MNKRTDYPRDLKPWLMYIFNITFTFIQNENKIFHQKRFNVISNLIRNSQDPHTSSLACLDQARLHTWDPVSTHWRG